jgi:hypothetical protein
METRRSRTYFEQVPIEVVKKLIEAQASKYLDEARAIEQGELGKPSSGEQVAPKVGLQ